MSRTAVLEHAQKSLISDISKLLRLLNAEVAEPGQMRKVEVVSEIILK